MWAEELEIVRKTLRKHDELINELLGKVNRLLASREGDLSHIKDRKLRLLRAIYDERENACISELVNKVGVSRKTLMKDLVELCNMGLVSYAIFGKHNNPGKGGNIPRLTVRGRLAAQGVHKPHMGEWGIVATDTPL